MAKATASNPFLDSDHERLVDEHRLNQLPAFGQSATEMHPQAQRVLYTECPETGTKQYWYRTPILLALVWTLLRAAVTQKRIQYDTRVVFESAPRDPTETDFEPYTVMPDWAIRATGSSIIWRHTGTGRYILCKRLSTARAGDCIVVGDFPTMWRNYDFLQGTTVSPPQAVFVALAYLQYSVEPEWDENHDAWYPLTTEGHLGHRHDDGEGRQLALADIQSFDDISQYVETRGMETAYRKLTAQE